MSHDDKDLCGTCKKDWTHHAVRGFTAEGKLDVACGYDPSIGLDPGMRWAQALLDRAMTAETNAAKSAKDLSAAAIKHGDAITSLGSRHKVDLQKLRTELERKGQDDVAEAITATKAESAEKLKEIQDALEALDKSSKEQLAFKERRLAETESANAVLAAAKTDLESRLKAAEKVTREARAEAVSASVQRDQLAQDLRTRNEEFKLLGRGNLSQSIRIGLLEGRLERYELRYGPLPEEPAESENVEEDEVIDLDQPKHASSVVSAIPSKDAVAAPKAAVAVPPLRVVAPVAKAPEAPRMVADLAITREVPPPPPAPTSSQSPPDADTVHTCSAEGCGKTATRIARDVWRLKDGGHLPPILSCDEYVKHAAEFYGLLDGAREMIANPPDDTDDVKAAFDDINP